MMNQKMFGKLGPWSCQKAARKLLDFATGYFTRLLLRIEGNMHREAEKGTNLLLCASMDRNW